MSGLDRLYGAVLRIIGLAAITRTDDSGDQQRVQINIGRGGPEMLEEVIDGVPRMGHYGLAYCPPDGSEAVVLFMAGRRSNGIVIATGHREDRPKDLAPGEAMLFNSLTGAFVRMSADGKIRSSGDWEHTGSFKATGDILDQSAGNTATMKIHRDAYNAHKHGNVTAGGAMTGVTDDRAP